MNKITLFPDQASHIDNLRHAMRSHKRVLLQAATGWGKTVGAAYMMSEAARKGHSSFFVVPRRQLLEQTAESLASYGIGFGFIAAGRKANPFQHIQLCTSGTLARRLDRLPFIPKIVFVDETHYGGAEIDAIIKFFHAAGCWVIGLSATPMKINGIHMSDWYDHMVVGPQIGELMRMGRLSGYRLLAPSRPDLSGVAIRNGEYVESQLSSRMESDTVLTGDMARHYKEQAFGKLNMAFGVSIRHVELMSEAFNAAGVPSASVHSKMADDEIKRRIKAFARRELLTLVSKDLCIFGFDLAASAGMDVTVEALTDGRPTESLPLQLQKWGRGLRRKEEPCWIFDHAGNSISADGSLKHGYPDDDRNWTLEREEKRSREGKERTIPVRQCEKCYGVMRPCPVCIFCGNPFPVKDRTIEEVEGDLVEVTREQLADVAKQERMVQGRAQTLTELVELGKRRGVKNPGYWAKKVMEGRRKP
jgi:superfamily II DNA or RNA helicase